MFNHLKIRSKLLASFGIITLIVLAVAVIGYLSAEDMHHSIKSLYQDRVLPLEQLGKVRINIDRMWADAHRYLLVPEDHVKIKREIAAAVEEIDHQMKLYRGTYLVPEEKEALSKFDTGWGGFQKAINDTIALVDRGGSKEALSSLQDGHSTRNARNAVRIPLEKLFDIQIKESEKLNQRSEGHFTIIHYTNICAALLGVLLSLFLGIVVANMITKPLRRAVAVIHEMSEGHLDTVLVDEGCRDEIGQLTRAAVAIAATVKAVTEDLREMIAAVEAGSLSFRIDSCRHKGEFCVLLNGINQLSESLSRPLNEVAEVMQKMAGGDTHGRMTGAYEGELRAMKSNVNRSLDSLDTLLGDLSSLAEKLALGDLRSNLSGNYQGDFAIMHANMNGAVDELRKILGSIAESSEQIAVAATETTAAAEDVAGQSEKQLVMLSEVSTVITETAASVKNISVNAEKGNALACLTATESNEGREQLTKLVQAMELIASSNTKITQISDRISRIAEKTHILALNAGIEAARAGEHGLGFGIVAQHIGKLAEEASVAVTDIANLTAEASHNVYGGITAAAETKSSIERIAQAARESEQTVHSIASAIIQQAAAVQQLSTNVAEVEERGEGNAAAATEISATMESLSKMIHRTAEQIGRFKL